MESRMPEHIRRRADLFENKRVRYKYTEEEMNEKRKLIVENTMQVADLMEEIQTIKKEQVDPLKQKNKLLVSQVRLGYFEETKELAGIYNYDDKTVEYLDEDGQVVETREMTRAERESLFAQRPFSGESRGQSEMGRA